MLTNRQTIKFKEIIQRTLVFLLTSIHPSADRKVFIYTFVGGKNKCTNSDIAPLERGEVKPRLHERLPVRA